MLSRSLCSVVSKWTYTKVEGDSSGFSEDFYTKIGLADLCEKNYQKIGTVELWSLVLVCLEHQGSLELVRWSQQFPYTFNVNITRLIKV